MMNNLRHIASLLAGCRKCQLIPTRGFPALTRVSRLRTRREISTVPDLPLFRALTLHDPKSTSIVHSASGRAFNYGRLLGDTLRAQDKLLRLAGHNLKAGDVSGQPVAFLAENSYDYARILLATEKYASKAQQVVEGDLENPPVLGVIERIEHGGDSGLEPQFGHQRQRGGMMLYTSGTTNRPKGVLLPHSALMAQIQSLVDAWEYSPRDRLLHLLPLHHIHGTVNAILAPLLAGSSIEFMFPFNPTAVWNRFASPFLSSQPNTQVNDKTPITFFTAVPTIYTRLLSTHASLPSETQQAAKVAISPQHLRLNISGSAALPTPIKSAWTELSDGNVLLERYGMTEVGMALSCGLNPQDRVDGSVGWPLPSVDARLVDPDTNRVIQPGEEVDQHGRERVGEIQLRGPTIFKEYWRNEKATNEEFVSDPDGKGKWFKTGDMAIRRHVQGTGESAQVWARGPMYFIQGRKSVDIIKTGGEKVSALEVERELLSLPQIAEAAVVGLPSQQWGQKVAAVLALKPALSSDEESGGKKIKKFSALDMRRALKDKLATYKIPQEMRVLEGGLPRNAMGKVNKKMLVKQVFGDML
ncbi:conserved hypothetical protein [Uncinocarpus reesii 1704]|uniref:AMP-dependent synthetase/ligase domain-containing protein n=1 Tax=Uncinocarpus reesii (strain UAMH 1704) TaxID=336963 RepID=C4JFN2_UNCRE|nr:uncharacterized protein UREG_02366 [Uncinocarpus reesii 1704]EEP77517.1 conserved hypothetical protein [Uncinocarpus reesii 1704]